MCVLRGKAKYQGIIVSHTVKVVVQTSKTI